MKSDSFLLRGSSGYLVYSGIAASLLSICLATQAQDERFAEKFYFSAGLGAGLPQETSAQWTFLFDSSLSNVRLEFDPGPRLEMQLGWQITDWLAVEAETGFLMNFAESKSGLQSEDITLYQVPIMANLVGQWANRSRWRPFAGVGVGGVETRIEEDDLFYGRSDDDFGFAWQAFAGVRYQISSRFDLSATYKYLSTTERSFGSFPARIEGIDTHSMVVAFSLRF